MTLNDLFFQKIFVNKTKLWYSRQEIANYSNNIKIMKNIRWKIIKILCISQLRNNWIDEKCDDSNYSNNINLQYNIRQKKKTKQTFLVEKTITWTIKK